jgi:hypothetical protein
MEKEYAVKRTRALFIEALLFQNEIIKQINNLIVKQYEDYISSNDIPVYYPEDDDYSSEVLNGLNNKLKELEERTSILYSILYDRLFSKKILYVDESDIIYDEEEITDEKINQVISSIEEFKTRKKR